jgi:hypothetical protein
MKSRSIQKNAEVGLVSPAKRTKPVTVWQLPDRYQDNAAKTQEGVLSASLIWNQNIQLSPLRD